MEPELDVHETAARRLLYDDKAPRIRRPMNGTALRFRRPAFLLVPLALMVSAGLPALGAAVLIADGLPWSVEVVAAGLAGFLALVLFVALLLAGRSERSFSLLVPTTLSTAHAFVGLCFVAAFVVAGPLGRAEVPQVLALLPGPQVETLHLQFAKAYIMVFLVVTAATCLAIALLRILGFRRVVAADA